MSSYSEQSLCMRLRSHFVGRRKQTLWKRPLPVYSPARVICLGVSAFMCPSITFLCARVYFLARVMHWFVYGCFCIPFCLSALCSTACVCVCLCIAACRNSKCRVIRRLGSLTAGLSHRQPLAELTLVLSDMLQTATLTNRPSSETIRFPDGAT